MKLPGPGESSSRENAARDKVAVDRNGIASRSRPEQDRHNLPEEKDSSPDQTTESPPVIQLNNIVKHYRSFHAIHILKGLQSVRALNGVTLNIGDGVTGLLGPNGAGKTTLIKVLLGLVRVSAGSGAVLGFDLLKQARLIRQNVGYLPEDDC